ncbi:Sideroflexin-5, putative [Perkinsus marinus ATCC 50983]|uniref:Sideroflexin-5, putative n=1 Tax=Perkinsus marinus (strain ATCC 50983 / TXsc) TaxID=423536 RepID=C5LKM5_PERM5|nr:Sideroflexin-5, putative [Perkinsus marinus ATCC 50983]EER02706.1 Sideroflexin-5, putative [Perkinsus marinus ATCC 50983]|eukprot:XP_002770690.1 Sideroflexin-5, putative [Perkinsus marinus ATCC 50983]
MSIFSSMITSETPPFSLTDRRYDQTSYWGRFRSMLDQCDPTTLLHSTREIYESRNALHDFQNGNSKLSDEQLWKARKLKESAIHPDTGELIPAPFRMSGYVPFNGPVCVGAVMAKSTPAIVFWHWVNQSQNAFVNYFNRNASSPVDDKTLTWSYLGAVGSAIAIAYGLSSVVKKRLSPARATVVLRWVGLPASMVASSANCFIMRHSELDSGITVYKKGTNEEVGTSKNAAKKALKEVVASRMLLQLPVFGVPPAFMTLPPIQRFCGAYPSMALPLSTMIQPVFAPSIHGF